MKKRVKSTSIYLIVMAAFLLLVNIALGFFLMRQSGSALISLMQTRMLDISNTAAAMIDGDDLEKLTGSDKGTPHYQRIWDTLCYFRDNIDLKYIYTVQVMEDGSFAFILDTDKDAPGQFGEPVVSTEALQLAGSGIPAADNEPFTDEWGTFYSAYTPVFNSKGGLAGIVAVDFSAQWYEDQIASLNRTIIISSVASLIIGAVIVITISSRSRKRIKEVDQQLNQLAGNLTNNLSGAAAEELRLLEEQSDRNGGDIDFLETKIRRIIDAEIRESQEQQKKLSDALQAAQQANQVKSVFLSNMSHEIRTPLNAIIGMDTLALKEENLPDTTREQLEKIGASAHHLLDIITDILDMSMIESGEMSAKNREFSSSALFDDITALMEVKCQEAGLDFEFRTSGDIKENYIGDVTMLREILVNILNNAVQYTPAPGTVSFTAEAAAERDDLSTLRFVIKDTGIGIEEEFLPHIFDSFSQEDVTRAHNSGSTGLGLAISRNLIDLLNGTISIESEKGVGSVFTVTVPLRIAEPQAGDEADTAENAADPSASDSSPEDLSGLRILVAEDLEINAEIIIDLLELEGMEADHAENGQIAVDMFLAHEPGYYTAILMDLRMPVLDGLGATRAIRSAEDRPDGQTIPIIAVTANALDEDIQRSMQAGIDVHLAKPVDADLLYGSISEALRKK